MATSSDARRYRFPPGYSLKNWSPGERPITLLGSVFDYFSLGQWIYHFTAYYKGAKTPIGHMAGALWILMIEWDIAMCAAETELKLHDKLPANHDIIIIEEHLKSGDCIEDKLKNLLRACEGPMLKRGIRATEESDAQLVQNAGAEFVESLFGRQLEATEQWMASVRFWISIFNRHCNPILRQPCLPAEL